MVDRRIDVEFDATLVFNQKTTIALLRISADAFKKLELEPCERKGGQAFYHWPDVVNAIEEKTTKQLLFNQKMTAALIDISVQAFSKWPITPALRIGREAFYHWPDVFAEYIKRRFPIVDPDDEDGGFLDLNQERARHSKEQADKLAIENAAARGEIIYTDHMGEIMGRALTAFRARLLAASSTLAPQVNPGNPNLARDLIHREHTDVLAELADFNPGAELGKRKPNGNGAVRDPEASAGADSKPVGRRRKKAKSGK